MHTNQSPSGGRRRTPARHTEAQVGQGWDPMERCDWEAVAAVLPHPWPSGAQRHDLRYWASRQRAHLGDRPGYRALAERWGVSEKVARGVCADVVWWADPRFGDEDPKRAQQGRTEGAVRAQQGRTEGAPVVVSDAILNVKGRTEGAVRAQQGRTEGAARAPKDNRDSNTNSNTDTIEHTSAPPPPAGAGQSSLFGQAVTESPRKPSATDRERAAAEDLLARLDAMRLERHAGGRALRVETWLPRMRRALRQQSAQEWIDGWTWVLRSPEAAWHRGEERGSPDRTRDLAMLLAHPEYAARRTWRGLEGPHGHDIEARPAEAVPEPVPALTPYQVAQAEREAREKRENAELIAKRDAERAEFFRARGIVLPF
jgi:hypothetical protein